MKVKTSEASGKTLNWMVAKGEGKDTHCEVHAGNVLYGTVASGFVQYRPSTNWAQGGPIIEREEICLKRQMPCSVGYEWNAWSWTKPVPKGGSSAGGSGPTPLIAAMRCYVTSKLGHEVEVPDGLH